VAAFSLSVVKGKVASLGRPAYQAWRHKRAAASTPSVALYLLARSAVGGRSRAKTLSAQRRARDDALKPVIGIFWHMRRRNILAVRIVERLGVNLAR